MKVRVTWDTTTDTDDDEQEVNLPEVVNVPDEVYQAAGEDSLSDWLSDHYGWCVESWTEAE